LESRALNEPASVPTARKTLWTIKWIPAHAVTLYKEGEHAGTCKKKLLPRLFRVRACVPLVPEQLGSEYPTDHALVKEMQGFRGFWAVSFFA
jgi:hypothetical protein